MRTEELSFELPRGNLVDGNKKKERKEGGDEKEERGGRGLNRWMAIVWQVCGRKEGRGSK